MCIAYVSGSFYSYRNNRWWLKLQVMGNIYLSALKT